MAKIAISGGIGSGKSVLANALRSRGKTVLDADLLAKECLDSSTIRSQVLIAFPALRDVPAENLRKELARLVFTDPASLRTLESLIHPCVAERISVIEKQSKSPIFVEVPVLAAAQTYDLLITVSAPDQTRIARLRAKGMDEQDIYNRMAVQPSNEEFIRSADLVFDGSIGSKEYEDAVNGLIAQVDGLING
ncbi:MAG: dephospho-CoA kinase [Candidatus Nanopelagicales bacterium]|jgi:dephospho-CoA kinase